MHGLSSSSSTFVAKTNKHQRTEEVDDLVSSYKRQRSFGAKKRSSTNCSSSLGGLGSGLNLPWDCTLDSNIVIETEKDFDSRDFSGSLSVTNSDGGVASLPSSEYFDWYKMRNMHTGEKNAVSFSSMMTDSSSYEEQYLSLKIFLAACSPLYKRELSVILFPLFVHFYLDLVNRCDSTAAQSFYTKFHNDHEEKHKELLQYLPKVTTQSQLVLFPMVHELRKSKVTMKLSPHVYDYFLQLLRHGNYSLVLQSLNRYFSIRSSGSSQSGKFMDHRDAAETVCEGEELFQNNDNVSCSSEEQQGIDSLQKSIAEMKRCTKLLKPSICLYTFSNTFQGLCTSCFSHNVSQLAAGFEDSSVRLWNISAKVQSDQCVIEGEKSIDSLQGSDVTILRGHHGPVYQTKFFPKDDFLASCSQDKSVRLWNLQTKKSLVEYKGHSYTVWDVAVNVNGTYFVSSSLDRTLRLWNTEYACPLRIYAGHNDSVDCLAFHPNGNYIASGSSDRSCRLWDLQSGQFVRVFVGHRAPVYSLAFSLDGKYLVSGDDEGMVKIWDLSNAQLLNDIKTPVKTVYNLAFSEDGAALACGGLHRSITIWESEALFKKKNSLIKSSFEAIGNYRTNSNSISSLKFSAGNLLFASCLTDMR